MEYLPMIIQSIITLAFAVITWRVKAYLDESAKERREFIEKIKANEIGTQALLRHALLRGYYSCKKRGKISYSEASSYQAMYEAYHLLGGNGVMDEVMRGLHLIPICQDSEIYS